DGDTLSASHMTRTGQTPWWSSIKRNLISVVPRRWPQLFLKCRAPSAADRSRGEVGRSLPPGPERDAGPRPVPHAAPTPDPATRSAVRWSRRVATPGSSSPPITPLATPSKRDTAKVVDENGKILGKVRAPLNTPDFSSFLLQAQSSKAKIIGLANAGGDTINSIKQASEFGIVQGGQNLAGLLVFISDVNAMGLPTAHGLILTEAWYWDLNGANRAV